MFLERLFLPAGLRWLTVSRVYWNVTLIWKMLRKQNQKVSSSSFVSYNICSHCMQQICSSIYCQFCVSAESSVTLYSAWKSKDVKVGSVVDDPILYQRYQASLRYFLHRTCVFSCPNIMLAATVLYCREKMSPMENEPKYLNYAHSEQDSTWINRKQGVLWPLLCEKKNLYHLWVIETFWYAAFAIMQ